MKGKKADELERMHHRNRLNEHGRMFLARLDIFDGDISNGAASLGEHFEVVRDTEVTATTGEAARS